MPGQGIQFSNFSLLEDRETHQLMLYLTTYGQEPEPADWASADCYKQPLTFAEANMQRVDTRRPYRATWYRCTPQPLKESVNTPSRISSARPSPMTSAEAAPSSP